MPVIDLPVDGEKPYGNKLRAAINAVNGAVDDIVAEKGVANGIATLDGTGVVPGAQVDATVAGLVGDSGSDTATALNATYVGKYDLRPMDIFLLVGESTITGYNALPLPTPNEADERIFQFGPENQVNGMGWIPAVDPLLHRESGTNGVGPGIPFAKTYLKKHEARAVGLVGAGYGGSGFSSTAPENWLAATVGGFAELTVTQAQAALAAAPSGSRIAGMLISLGANDVSMTYTSFFTALYDLIAFFRTQLGISDLPAVLLGMSEPYIVATGANARAIEDSLRDHPNGQYNVAYVSAGHDNLKLGEIVHFSARGQEERGVAAVVGLEHAISNIQWSEPRTPGNLRIVANGPSAATVTWDHPEGRVTSFSIRWRENGGNWTTVTAAYPYLATSYEITSAAALIEVEVAAVNNSGPYTSVAATATLNRVANLTSRITSVDTNYIVTDADDVIFSTASGNIYVTLPDYAYRVGRRFRLKATGAGGIIVNSAGSVSSVDGASSVTIATGGYREFLSDGTTWQSC